MNIRFELVAKGFKQMMGLVWVLATIDFFFAAKPLNYSRFSQGNNCRQDKLNPGLVDKCGSIRYYYCMRKKIQNGLSVAVLLGVFLLTPGLYGQTGFTQQDRETLIELKVTMREMDKRISDLREDMNKRFELMDKRIEQIDKRFEQVDKRFEQVDKRFEQMMNFVWILAAIFTGMFAFTIGFALWDRRTMIRPFETKVAEIDGRINKNEEKMAKLLAAIKEYATTDKKLAALVERFNIL